METHAQFITRNNKISDICDFRLYIYNLVDIQFNICTFLLTYYGLVTPYGGIDPVHQWLIDGTKPLPEPILTCHLTWHSPDGNLKICSWVQSMSSDITLLLSLPTYISTGINNVWLVPTMKVYQPFCLPRLRPLSLSFLIGHYQEYLVYK